MGSSGFVRLTMGDFTLRNRAGFEEQKMVWEALLVVGKCCHQYVKDCLFIQFKLNLHLMNNLNQDIETGGGGIEGFGIKEIVTGDIVVIFQDGKFSICCIWEVLNSRVGSDLALRRSKRRPGSKVGSRGAPHRLLVGERGWQAGCHHQWMQQTYPKSL
jgi:hypothetical protein